MKKRVFFLIIGISILFILNSNLAKADNVFPFEDNTYPIVSPAVEKQIITTIINNTNISFIELFFLNLSGTNANQNLNVSPYDFEMFNLIAQNTSANWIGLGDNGMPQAILWLREDDLEQTSAVDFEVNMTGGIKVIMDFVTYIDSAASGIFPLAAIVLRGAANTKFDDPQTQNIESLRLNTGKDSVTQTQGTRNFKGIRLDTFTSTNTFTGGTLNVFGIDNELSSIVETGTSGNLEQYGQRIKRNALINLGAGTWNSMGLVIEGFTGGTGVTKELSIWVKDGLSHFGGLGINASQIAGKLLSIDQYWIRHDAGDNITLNETLLNDTIEGLTASVTYNATSIATEEGTLLDGNLASVQAIDTNFYNVSEDAGISPLLIGVNFTGVNTFSNILMRTQYLGGLGHEIEILTWNFIASAWESHGDITDQSTMVEAVVDVLDASDHISGGEVRLRFDHVQNGVGAHEFRIDYIALQEGFTSITNFNHDSTLDRDDIQNHPWAMSSNASLRNMTGDLRLNNLTIWENETHVNLDGGGLIVCLGYCPQ